MNSHPNIYEHLDWRLYLKEWVTVEKSLGLHSERAFAKRAGFASPSFLKLLLDGKRDLTPKSLECLARGLRLCLPEARYLEKLVAFAKARKTETKSIYYRQLVALRVRHGVKDLSSDQFEYFSSPYLVALRELLSLEKFSRAPAKHLSKLLGLSEEELQRGLETLQRLNLVRFHPSTQRYEILDLAIQTPQAIQSLLLRTYHKRMIEKALASLDDVATHKREVGALTLSVSEASYSLIIERIRLFRRQLNQEFSGDPNASSVYQLNIQFFPLFAEDENPVTLAKEGTSKS